MVAPQGKRKLEQFLIVLMDEQGGAGLSPRMICWSRTPARNGRSSIGGSPPSTQSSFAGPRRMRTPAGWRQFRASARSLRRLSCRRRSCGKLRARPRSRRLARSGFAAVHHRRQAEAAGDQQARQQIFAQAADPWSASGSAVCGRGDTPLGRWAKALMARAHRNVAVVAFANKLARIAWAVLRRGEPFAATGIPAAG